MQRITSTSRLITSPARSLLMSKVRREGSDSEKLVRSLVRSHRQHFRVNTKRLPGSPDISNSSKHWAIFVHGCFWHAHEGCHLWRIPRANRAFWTQKFTANRDRDMRKISELRSMGFKVLVIWQCEVESPIAAQKLSRFFNQRRLISMRGR